MDNNWQKAPVKTEWGPDMVELSIEIDNDHTLSLYCESSQTEKVWAVLQTPKIRRIIAAQTVSAQ